MSQSAVDAHVSLHPLASRHGTQSSTLVSVNLPASPRSSSQSESKYQDGQGTPRLNSTIHDAHWSHPRPYGVSPKSSPTLPTLMKSSAVPVYGLQHGDLDDYPIIHDEPLPCADSADCHDNHQDPFADRSECPSQHSDASPIRAMSAAQLAELHEKYVSLDVPHHVVFPFLHGVDGTIPAQNAFFGAPMTGQPAPNYRGLTIVRADMPSLEEMQRMEQASRRSKSASRARARTFSSVTTQSSNSGGDSDEDGHFDTTWQPTRSNPVPMGAHTISAQDHNMAEETDVPERATSSESAASIVAASTVSTVSSQNSRPSLFSVSSEAYSTGSRTSVSTVSDTADEPRKSTGGSDAFRRNSSPRSHDPQPRHSVLNSTVFPSEIIRPPSISRTMYGRNCYGDLSGPGSFGDEDDSAGEMRRIGPSFLNPSQASGVSLRNFKIQCAKYATISDIVIYCPFGYHSGAMTLAKWVREAQASLRRERLSRGWGGLQYNVFVVTDAFDAFESNFPHLVSVDSNGFGRNRVDFVDREREEMERLTRASEIDDHVWLGCTADAPGVTAADAEWADEEPVTPDEHANPNSFSICIQALESVDPPTQSSLRSAERFLDFAEAAGRLDVEDDKGIEGKDRRDLLSFDSTSIYSRESDMRGESREGMLVLGPNGWTPKTYSCAMQGDLSTARRVQARAAAARLSFDRPSQTLDERSPLLLDASSVVHLEYPASGDRGRWPGWEETMAKKVVEMCVWIKQQACPNVRATTNSNHRGHGFSSLSSTLRNYRDGGISPSRSFSPAQSYERLPRNAEHRLPPRTRRPRRVLLHCADGYTETSVLALSYLMFSRGLSLPEAYLDLQLRANRSFFVYPTDVSLLQKIEEAIRQMRARSPPGGEANESRRSRHSTSHSFSGPSSSEAQHAETRRLSLSSTTISQRSTADTTNWVKSLAGATGLMSSINSNTQAQNQSRLSSNSGAAVGSGICRTATPTPKTTQSSSSSSVVDMDLGEKSFDHSSWFDKSKFDGSFPSRILPFLYLGNLAHASNVDMLRVLGITHLVSVGETALAPPDRISAKVKDRRDYSHNRYQRASTKTVLSEDPTTVPSLTYESEGISVLNVRNVSDDGIDSLRGTMREAVQFIESARLKGGKVLVHCRVGVSRSTTIVLAYVMAHLDLGLVESYLLVRSRRLNIVIQPHLLFLWELRGWETFLHKAKRNQASLSSSRNTSRAGSHRRETSRRPSFNLSALSIQGCSGRSEEGSDSFESAHSSPLGSPSVRPMSIDEQTCNTIVDAADEDLVLGAEIGAGAGSIHGFEVPNVVTLDFGSGSPNGLPYRSTRLTWGHLAREIADLNSRYFV